MTLTICHICIMLSSDTEQITQGSLGFQLKSEILAVCPPWINYLKQNKTPQASVSHFIFREIQDSEVKFIMQRKRKEKPATRG